jgi:adenine-specific DNA-methyltransferase
MAGDYYPPLRFPHYINSLDYCKWIWATAREELKEKGENFDKSYVSSEFLNQAMDDLLKNTVNKRGTDEIVELFGEKVFAYPKNELLLQRIIEYTTEEDDIVLDFFVGCGTTGAVAHKMRRQYIVVEQMDYVKEITIERLKKVINGEQGGISKSVKWNGGGSFIYCELAKANEVFVEKIQNATNTKELIEIWELMQEKAFISYKLDVGKFQENIKEFEDLDLDNQKRFLIEVLDKNMLYVNYSEIDDTENNVSQEDKRLNRLFYES